MLGSAECPGPELAPEATGRGLRVAVVDSGVLFRHPHLRLEEKNYTVARVDGVITVEPGGTDRVGHGTCCAALIHWLAPGAEIVAVGVTDERGLTDSELLAHGITAASDLGADLICVPLGTGAARGDRLEQAVAAASARDALVIAARPESTGRILPADAPLAIGVRVQPGVDVAQSGSSVAADPEARPAPSHRSNFRGPSLSAARVSAALARVGEASGHRGRALWLYFYESLTLR